MTRAIRGMSESVRTTSFRTLVRARRGAPRMVRVNATERVLVYGATGHTGRFVVDELLRRGLTPVLAGRSAERLAAVAPRHAALDRRVVGVDDPDLLRRAVAGVGAVVNCAGPFLDTALPLARAAVEAGAHYLDVTAEQPVVQELYRELDGPARDAGRRRRPGHGVLRRARRPARHRRARRGLARGRGRGRDRPGPLVADRRHPGHRRPQHRDPPGDPRRRAGPAGRAPRRPAPGPTRSRSATQPVVRAAVLRGHHDRPAPRRRRAPLLPQHRPARRPPRRRDPATVRGRRGRTLGPAVRRGRRRTPRLGHPTHQRAPAATSTPSPHRSSSRAPSDSSTGATAAPAPWHRERRSTPATCSPRWSETRTAWPSSGTGTAATALSSGMGAPARIRTWDKRIRRPLLYPTELRGLARTIVT